MPPKKAGINWRLWTKMLVGGGGLCIGGPALVWYVSPTEEELFLKYNPDLQKRSLANRQERQQDFDDFVMRLREYSKSDKPIWIAEAEALAKSKENRSPEKSKLIDEIEQRKKAMREESIKSVPGGSL